VSFPDGKETGTGGQAAKERAREKLPVCNSGDWAAVPMLGAEHPSSAASLRLAQVPSCSMPWYRSVLTAQWLHLWAEGRSGGFKGKTHVQDLGLCLFWKGPRPTSTSVQICTQQNMFRKMWARVSSLGRRQPGVRPLRGLQITHSCPCCGPHGEGS
jgi:hypothetical protein